MLAFKSQFASLLNKLSPWLLLGFLSLLCWFLASLAWLVIAPPKAISLPPVTMTQTIQKQGFNPSMFDVFKQPKQPDPVATQNTAPIAPPDFTLEGVMLSTPEELSTAIIGNQGKSIRYRIGEKVHDSQFVLSQVHWKKIILTDTQGNDVEISLYKEFDLNSGANINTRNEGNSGSSKNKAAFSSSTIQPQSVPNIPSLPPKISEQKNGFLGNRKKPVDVKAQVNTMLDKAASELENNPAGYLNKMGVISSGNGYTITDQMNNNIRRNIGLQPGDQILSVNGQTLGNPQQDAALLKEVQRTRSAEIQVQRGSQVITIRQQF